MANAQFQFVSESEADTARLGQALARAIDYGVIALNGPLGAGKTRLVQAIAGASGVDPRNVVSPTFVLIHEYYGTRTIYHIDAYRLRDEDEFLQLGVEEYFAPPNLVLIEWAERVERALPEDLVEVAIEVRPGDERAIRITGHGAAGKWISGIEQALAELRG